MKAAGFTDGEIMEEMVPKMREAGFTDQEIYSELAGGGVKIDPYTGMAQSYYAPAPARTIIEKAKDYLGIKPPPATPLDLEAVQKHITPYQVREEVFGTGKTEEFRKVAGRFLAGASGGITDVLKGEKEMPETTIGTVAGAAAELAGFLVGPAKFAKGLTGSYFSPSISGLRNMVTILTEGGATLGIASGIASLAPAFLENDDFTGIGKQVLHSAVTGAITGAIYPVFGIVPTKALRVVTGLAVMDLLRSGRFIGSNLYDIARGVTDGTIDKNVLAQRVFDYLMDTYFILKTPALKAQLKAMGENVVLNDMLKLNPEEVESTILAIGDKGLTPKGPAEGDVSMVIESLQGDITIESRLVEGLVTPKMARRAEIIGEALAAKAAAEKGMPKGRPMAPPEKGEFHFGTENLPEPGTEPLGPEGVVERVLGFQPGQTGTVTMPKRTFVRELMKSPDGQSYFFRRARSSGVKKILNEIRTDLIKNGFLPNGATIPEMWRLLKNEKQVEDTLHEAVKGPTMAEASELDRDIAAYETGQAFDAYVKAEGAPPKGAAGEALTPPLVDAKGDLTTPKSTPTIFKQILSDLGISPIMPEGVKVVQEKDYKKWYRYLQLPLDVARTHLEFGPTYDVQRAREVKRRVLETVFGEATQPYFSLAEEARAKIDKALLAGEQQGRDMFSRDELTIFGLTDPEILGYEATRTSLNDARNMLFETMHSYGVPPDKLKQFEAELQGYVPHRWYGDWAVVVKSPVEDPSQPAGKTIYMSAVDKKELAAEAARVKAMYPIDKIIVMHRTKIPYETFQEAPPFAVQRMFELASQKAGIEADVKAALDTALADLYKSKGWGMHFIKRKNVPGYEEDLTRPLAEYFTGFTGYLTKMEAMRAFPDAIKAIPRNKPELHQYAVDYIKYVTGEHDRFAVAKNLAYFWYLFSNVKSSAMQLTQNLILGWPVLSKYTNMALPKMVEAMAKVATGNLTPEERGFIDNLERGGFLDSRLAQEISGYLGKGLYQTIQTKWKKAMSIADIFRHGETFNRKAMAVALYDAGIRDFNKAADLIDEAHFRYGTGNQIGLMREFGGYLSPLATFRSWFINYLTWTKNQIKAGDIAPAAKSLFALMLFGGFSALPFWKTMDDIYLKLNGSDIETDVRQLFGRKMGQLIMHGTPASIGVEFSGSIGMGDILPTDLPSVIGVFGDIPTRANKVRKSLQARDYLRAIEDASPEVLRNPLAAYRMYTQGQTSRGGRPVMDIRTGKPMKLTATEAFLKAFGFQPERASEQFHIGEVMDKLQQARQEKKQAWADRYTLARLNRDGAGMQEVIKEIYDYNYEMQQKGRPQDQITLAEISAALKSRMRPINLPPRYMMPRLQELRKNY